MSADLTCKACRGSGWERSFVNPWPDEPCPNCDGEGRRRPELHEWDALKAERDRLHDIVRDFVLVSDGQGVLDRDCLVDDARAALDPEHDLAERTRRIKADE